MIQHDKLEFGPVRDDEIPALEQLLAQALVMSPPWMQFWMRATGYNHYRVVRHCGRLAAGLGMFHTHQYLGGQPVPNMGINGVGVAPAYRGRGVGKLLMQRTLEELHAAGRPLAILYPSTLAFYRSVGFERAGTRIVYELPLDEIDAHDHTLETVELAPAQFDQLKQLYVALAQRTHGRLDRATFVWERILHPPDTTVHAYLVQRAGQAVGYVVWNQGARSDPLRVLDFCALDPQAGRCLLTLLADHRTMISAIVWNGTPVDPIISLLGEQHVKVTMMYDWLLRIVDVRAALAARGYPRGLDATLELAIHDDQLAANTGNYVLSITDGRGTVESGGAGRIRLGVRELAALYTCHLTPADIDHVGTIAGSDQELELLGLAFSGPRPRMSDAF